MSNMSQEDAWDAVFRLDITIWHNQSD